MRNNSLNDYRRYPLPGTKPSNPRGRTLCDLRLRGHIISRVGNLTEKVLCVHSYLLYGGLCSRRVVQNRIEQLSKRWRNDLRHCLIKTHPRRCSRHTERRIYMAYTWHAVCLAATATCIRAGINGWLVSDRPRLSLFRTDWAESLGIAPVSFSTSHLSCT
jgi:hypothetical protein